MEYERELKQTFNTATYYVRALCKDRTLFVEVEQENTGYQWRNQFVNSYIEEMTSKTGNFKTFDKFCRMIYSALQSNNNNGSVFIDLLTYHDLQILKARKAAKAGIQSQSLNATQHTKNKKYLILTYVVEFDRVHYPLALKLDENPIDIKLNNRCARATDTTRQLLSHSIQSISSSNSSNSQSSPNLNRNKVNKHKHYHSTPNLNDDENIKINNISSDKLNEILEENMKLKMILKQENNNIIIQEFEEEINILKKELQNKPFEIKRITKNTKQFQQKNILSRLDELEDEIERLSTQLLSERTKYRRINREFHSEKIELNKKIEMLQASNQHYKTKCKSLKNELNSTKNTLDNLRVRTSKQRLYSSSKQRLKSSETLRRSRSRNNNKYYPKRNNRNNRKKKINPKKHGSNLFDKYNNNNKYYRSSSAHRFQNKSRSRSPSIRFDPTEWAKNRKDKIARAKVLKNTFGKSRSPSPFRTSRSVSPINGIKYQKKRNKSKNKNKKRNSFGTTISISPKSRKHKNKKNNNKRRLPLHPNSNYSSSTVNDENDLNLINSIKKRQKRILSISDDDDDDDECESTFNPTKEIESIDSRLNALQKFLRAAKSSS